MHDISVLSELSSIVIRFRLTHKYITKSALYRLRMSSVWDVAPNCTFRKHFLSSQIRLIFVFIVQSMMGNHK